MIYSRYYCDGKKIDFKAREKENELTQAKEELTKITKITKAKGLAEVKVDRKSTNPPAPKK